MAVHVVGFTDIIHYEGNTPIFKGRQLLTAIYDTKEYKALKPGDQKSIYPYSADTIIDFVAPTPFIADLTVNTENQYPEKTVTLYDQKHDTYYPMFLADFLAMVSQAIFIRGRVTGRFGYVKKNTNFGIVYLGEN
jgi:hypothetical protein